MSFSENLTFAIKTIKTLTSLFAYEKCCSAFSAAKKIIVYYDKNWLLHTTKIFGKSKIKG